MRFFKNLAFIGLLALAGTPAAVAQNVKFSHNTDDSKIALQGYSPVSYLDRNQAERGVKAYKITHDGVAYYFTSAAQKATFEKNPAKYVPQYGGYCALGAALNAKFRTDPNKFLVKDGKLFLFLNNNEVDAKDVWLKGNHEELVAKANTNWQKLQTQP